MIRLAFILLLVVSSGYYLLFLLKVLRGLKPTAGPRNTTAPMVSVIVAARDEEPNILQCITSLSHQSYDSRNYEIIVVDDHSRDRTLALAQEAAARIEHPAIRVLTCKDGPDQQGKPAAISLGVENARGDIIFCTDADCIVPKDWIASMTGCFTEAVVFVAGPVTEQPAGSFVSKMQALEFLGLITTGAGLIGSGNPIICNGANIAYRKSAFLAVNGYGEDGTFCDDETLMQRMVRRNMGTVVFNFDPSSTVTTSTPETVSGFWHQRTRWAAKRGHYEDKSVLARLIVLYSFFLVLFFSSLAALVDPVLFIPLLVVLVLKVTAEMIVLRSGARLFQQRISVWHFVIAELLHVPYIVFAAFIGQFSALRWKNRALGQ